MNLQFSQFADENSNWLGSNRSYGIPTFRYLLNVAGKSEHPDTPVEPRVTSQCKSTVMWLPSRHVNFVEGLKSLDVYPPDFDDYFERRAEGYAKLGIGALGLIERLCGEYGISQPERPDYYSPREGFQRKIDEIAKHWSKRQATVATMVNSMGGSFVGR